MRTAAKSYLLRFFREEDLTRAQIRQSEIVAFHIARAGWTMLEARCRWEIGVEIMGTRKRECKGAPIYKTRSGKGAGGCRALWPYQLMAARYATAYVMATINEDEKVTHVLYKHLWRACGKIATMECKRACWKKMKSPIKNLPDGPRRLPIEMEWMVERRMGDGRRMSIAEGPADDQAGKLLMENGWEEEDLVHEHRPVKTFY